MNGSDAPHTHLPASQLRAGMFIDLENDFFATQIPEGTPEQDRLDYEVTIEGFLYEYAIVANVEQESSATTVVHCDKTSFACPPYHRIKVATHAWVEASGFTHHVQDETTQAEFDAAFNTGNTADNN